MSRISKHIISVLCLPLLMACSKSYPSADVAPLSNYAIAAASDACDVSQLAECINADYPNESKALTDVLGYGIDQWLRSPAVAVFSPVVDSLAPSVEDVSRDLGYILGKASDLNLEIGVDINSSATVVWGNPRSIIFCDSVMLIALNHYLGADYEGYLGLDAYRRQVKEPAMLPYDMAEALVATAYPFESDDNPQLINRMTYEGALTMAKLSLVKDSNEALALGYDKETFAQLEKNESEIWRKMLASSMIFDRSTALADRLLRPAPFTVDISPDVPGRVGRYIGYKIVDSYMKQTGATLADVLSPAFYMSLNPLAQAGYNP